MNTKRIVAIVAVALLVVAVLLTKGFGLFGRGHDGELTLYGNVDIREVDMAFRVGGRINQIDVEEGEKVTPGEKLALLDPAPIDSRIAQADASIAQARAQLAELRNGSRAQDVAQAKAQVDAAQAALKKAQEDVDRRQGLVGPGAVSRDVWQATLAQRDQAKAQADAARQNYSKLKQGARPEEIAAAQAQMHAAMASRGTLVVDRNDNTLTAATAGTVVTRAQEPGAIVQAGQTVLTISIDRPLRVRAYVAESDLSRVAPGMNVLVTADGNTKTYHGTIGYVSPQAEFTPKTVQTQDLRTDLVYRLRIIVSDPDDALRQGQPVTGFRVQAGKYVDGIQFQYGGSRWGSVHGVGNHWSYEIAFQPGEYVVRVDYRSGSLMDAVGFVTNMGHGYGLFGGGGGTYAAFYPTPGQFLGCMSGRSGSSIDRMIFASTGPR